MWARVQGPYHPWPGSRPWPHSTSKFLGSKFSNFSSFFHSPSVSGLDRGSDRLSPVSAGSLPYASCLDRGSRRRSPPSTALLAVCPCPRPGLPSAVLGLVRLLAVCSQLRRGLPSTVPGLGRLLTFVPGLDRALCLGSPLAVHPISREKQHRFWLHVYSPIGESFQIYETNDDQGRFLLQVAFKVSYKLSTRFFNLLWEIKSQN